MISIDKYAYSSKLKHIEPLQKLFFAVLSLGVCLWANHGLIAVMLILIMGALTVLKGGTPLGFLLKLLLVPMSFLLLGVVAIAVNIAPSPEGFWVAFAVAGTWIGFSYSGLVAGLQLFLKVLAACACLYFLALSTPMVDLLAALQRLKVPKLMVELMGLIYRFIFVTLETAENIYNSQNCRLGYISFATGLRSLGALVSVLFIKTYKRADELYTALEARGYEGELQVLQESSKSHWSGYVVALAVNAVLVLAALTWK